MDERTEQMYELMRKESHRLKTFQMYPPWPKDYVDIKKLAKAGFFYAFDGDNVHCAFCRGQVCRWDRDDDPMTEHARHFTTCPFIMGGEVGNEPIGDDPFPGPKRPRPYDVCGAYPNFPPDDPRYEQEQRSYIVESNEPQQQQYYPPQQDQSQGVNVAPQPEPQMQPQHIIQPMQQNQAHTQPLMTQTRRPIPPIEPAVQANEQSQSRNYPIYQQLRNQDYSLQQQQLSISSNTGNQNQSSDQMSSNLIGICKICYTNAIEMVFLPCGHSVSCQSCAQRLHDCPFCRETITTRIRTYLV